MHEQVGRRFTLLLLLSIGCGAGDINQTPSACGPEGGCPGEVPGDPDESGAVGCCDDEQATADSVQDGGVAINPTPGTDAGVGNTSPDDAGTTCLPEPSALGNSCEAGRCYCDGDDLCYAAAQAEACCAVAPDCFDDPPNTGVVVEDDFERAELGPSWERQVGSDAQIVDGAVAYADDWVFVEWAGSSFGNDQFSEVERAQAIPSFVMLQPWVRRRASDGARYGTHFNLDPGQAQWEIKFDGVPGPSTRILATNTTAPRPKPGDRVRIEATGSDPVRVEVFLNGTSIMVGNDSNPNRSLSGTVGFVSRWSVDQTVPTNSPVCENWWGGEL